MSQDSGYQGSPGHFDVHNPTIVPNSYVSYAVNGSCSPVSPAQQVLNNPRVAGTVTVTVGGTAHAGDVLTITFANGVLHNGKEVFAHTVAAGPETLAEAAEALAAACNNDSVLQQHDIYATSYNGVMTLHQLGPLSTQSTVTGVVSGSAHTTTLTIANSGKLTAGTGVLVPLNNSQLMVNGSTLNLRYLIPVLLSPPQVAAVAAAGLSAK